MSVCAEGNGEGVVDSCIAPIVVVGKEGRKEGSHRLRRRRRRLLGLPSILRRVGGSQSLSEIVPRLAWQ